MLLEKETKMSIVIDEKSQKIEKEKLPSDRCCVITTNGTWLCFDRIGITKDGSTCRDHTVSFPDLVNEQPFDSLQK